jgi:hypothetical protein
VVDFLLVSLHHLRSTHEKGWNPKFHESSFKNEDLVADQSSGLKAENMDMFIWQKIEQFKISTREG